MKPRYLRILVVDDAPGITGEFSAFADYPFECLDQITRWSREQPSDEAGFIEHLKTGTLPEFDLLFVDFNFMDDPTVPAFRPDDITPNSILSQMVWPPALKVGSDRWNNTGILIGTTLSAIQARRDMPTAIAVLTGYKSIILRDAPSAVLLAQILTCAGRAPEGKVGRDILTATANMMSEIESSPIGVMPRAILSYREKLWKLLENRQDLFPHLWLVPFSVERLLTSIDGVLTQEDLCQVLSFSGLELYDRDERLHSIDLRSLFADLLMQNPKTLRFEWLPIESVKEGGRVRVELDRLSRWKPEDLIDLKAYFKRDCGARSSVKEMRNAFHRLIALHCAYIEEYFEKQSQLSRCIDPLSGLEDSSHPRYSDLLNSLAEFVHNNPPVFSNLDLAQDKYPLNRIKDELEDLGESNALSQALGYSGPNAGKVLTSTRHRILKKLLTILMDSGIVAKKPNGGIVTTKGFRGLHPKIYDVSLEGVGLRLGFPLNSCRTQIKTILESAGLNKTPDEFLRELETKSSVRPLRELCIEVLRYNTGWVEETTKWPICLRVPEIGYPRSSDALERARRYSHLKQSLIHSRNGTHDKYVGCELASKCAAARELSGDLCVARKIEGGLIFLVVDVQGHGVGAGAVSLYLQGLTQGWKVNDPTDLAVSIRKQLDDLESGSNVFVGAVNYSRQELKYIGSGDILAFILRRGSAIPLRGTIGTTVKCSGSSDLTEAVVPLEPKDLIVVATDGLYDSDQTACGLDEGLKKLTQAILKVDTWNIAETADKVVAGLRGQAKGFEDDSSILLVKYLGTRRNR